MVVIIVVHPLVAYDLRSSTSSSACQAILHIAQDLETQIQPLFSGEVRPILLPYFKCSVSSLEKAEEIIARLQGLEGIAAAYIKPQGRLTS